MEIPKNIKREHIIKAINEYKKKKIPIIGRVIFSFRK